MTKFTKGPWQVADKVTVYALNDFDTNRFQLIVQAAGNHSAKASELEANANLIAAAPDLYEALEVLLVDIRNKHSLSEANLVGAGTRRALIAARLALAKARGE